MHTAQLETTKTTNTRRTSKAPRLAITRSNEVLDAAIGAVQALMDQLHECPPADCPASERKLSRVVARFQRAIPLLRRPDVFTLDEARARRDAQVQAWGYFWTVNGGRSFAASLRALRREDCAAELADAFATFASDVDRLTAPPAPTGDLADRIAALRSAKTEEQRLGDIHTASGETDEADEAWQVAVDALDATAADLLSGAMPSAQDELQRQKALIAAQARPDGRLEAEDLQLAYAAALRTLEALAHGGPPPVGGLDPDAAEYVAARRLETEVAYGNITLTGEQDKAMSERWHQAIDRLLASEPTTLAGVAVRLGYIIGDGFNRCDYDAHLDRHKREAITPPTGAELYDADENHERDEAVFRALAFLHQGIEKLLERQASGPDLGAMLAQADALWSADTETAEDDRRAAELLGRFVAAPIRTPADAVAKVRWLYRAELAGKTGREAEVLRQLLTFLGVDPETTLQADPYYAQGDDQPGYVDEDVIAGALDYQRGPEALQLARAI